MAGTHYRGSTVQSLLCSHWLQMMSWQKWPPWYPGYPLAISIYFIYFMKLLQKIFPYSDLMPIISSTVNCPTFQYCQCVVIKEEFWYFCPLIEYFLASHGLCLKTLQMGSESRQSSGSPQVNSSLFYLKHISDTQRSNLRLCEARKKRCT